MPTLNWIGKDKVVNHHQDVPYKVLDHKYGFKDGKQGKDQVDTANMIIHGDNLEALKSLLPKYEGKIDCIYIDPPYNTGNENWVYNDNVNHPRIKKWLGEVVGKEGDDLTRHDKWLCLMYPRLKLLNKLLCSTGVLFISIDKNECSNLKFICDEIFGPANFVSNICVINNLKGRSDDKFIATAHENLLIYKKNEFITNGVPLPEMYHKEYKFTDDNGKYRLLGLRKRGSNSRREDRPNLFYPIYFNPHDNLISLENFGEGWIKIIPKLSDGSEGNWRWGAETVSKNLKSLQCQLVKTRNEYDVFQKDYLVNNGNYKRIKPKSVWMGSIFSSEAGTLQLKSILGKGAFETPKSTELIKYCLYQATKKDSIVLDSFAGSGTTAHAVLNLNKEDDGNRKCILIEMEDYADSITAERVKRVINGYGENNKKVEGTGGSFNYYELGKSLFLEDDLLNEDVGLDKIKEYIWYSETRTGIIEANSNHIHHLGSKDEVDYYFYYDKDKLTTLDYNFLSTIKAKAIQYVIYADTCLLTDDFMSDHNITFKKIPRDITRF